MITFTIFAGFIRAPVSISTLSFHCKLSSLCKASLANLKMHPEGSHPLKSTLGVTIIIFAVSFVIMFQATDQFGFQPRLITRFCYNSPNMSSVNSQCVLCNYYSFDSTLLGCTGTTALSVNITTNQAFCVISQCLGQIRQSPVFLGRRRRKREVLAPFDEQFRVEGNGGDEGQDIIMRSVHVDVVNNDASDEED